jgi:hypothetical protein
MNLPFHPWEKDPGTHWIGDWVGLRTGLDIVEKKCIPVGNQNPNVHEGLKVTMQNLATCSTESVLLAVSRFVYFLKRNRTLIRISYELLHLKFKLVLVTGLTIRKNRSLKLGIYE